MAFSNRQMHAVEITERICSIFSLLGAIFIITTFLTDKSFHKPINRLVFFAAWGNIMANVATFISTSGIRLGPNGFLCQFQAFLIQWFMVADTLWTLAMACNVYLTFSRKYDAKQLRSLEWKYILLCYGVPFIPAFILFFVRSESRGKAYGSAVLWCWISIEWDILRIAVGYGPVWLMIIPTFAIYIAAGKVMFQWRRTLLKYTQNPQNDTSIHSPIHPSSPKIVKTVKIYVTREPAQISSSTHPSGFDSGQTSVLNESNPPSTRYNRRPRKSIPSLNANRAAINYCKCALLFFVAMIVTWVPSTVNRLVTLVHPKDPIFELGYASGLVLPLQGFWNATIYIFTSLPACKALMRRIKTALHINQMPRWRNGRFSTTAASSGSHGPGARTNQQTVQKVCKSCTRMREMVRE